MTYVIDALESGGFVERRLDPHDRRIRRVVPTATGRTLLATARAALRDIEIKLMRDLTSVERTQLRRLLARIARGVDDIESC